MRLALSCLALTLFAAPLHADGLPSTTPAFSPATYTFKGCIEDKSCHIITVRRLELLTHEQGFYVELWDFRFENFFVKPGYLDGRFQILPMEGYKDHEWLVSGCIQGTLNFGYCDSGRMPFGTEPGWTPQTLSMGAYYPSPNDADPNFPDDFASLFLRPEHVTTVPEPVSVALLGSGLVGLACFRRRRRGGQ